LNPIKWGIIGCGDVTEVKSGPALQKARDSKLVAVMRRNTKLAADYSKRHNVPRFYDDASQLINDPGVDAVYIATPPNSHASYAEAVARAGKPVYVEKPMARTHIECLTMIEACKSNNVPLFVAYYRRALPYFLKIKKLVEEEAIGSVYNIEIRLRQPNLLTRNSTTPWRLIKKISGGGLFFDLACHQFDLIDFIFGPILSTKGHATNAGGFYEVEDTVTASFEFASGLKGKGEWCFCSKDHEDTIELTGSKGSISFSVFGFTPITQRKNRQTTFFDVPMPSHVQQPLIQSVVDTLKGKDQCPSTGESAARTNKIMEEIIYG